MLLNDPEQSSGSASGFLETGQARPLPVTSERHGYAPPAGRRIVALIGTGTIYAAALVGFFFTLSRAVPVHVPAAALTVELLPLASPPEAPRQEKEAPRPVQKNEKQPAPPKVTPVERTIAQITAPASPLPAATPRAPDPSPQQKEAVAPRTLPAPPAPQAANHAPDTWEGKLLAQLAKYRRYPGTAIARRQQGVPYIRFVMDRQGKVLSSRLERPSGFPDLDREAVALPKRAQPLPKPPDDRPGATLELVVPVEFFLR